MRARLHVVCGGGTGSLLLRNLHGAGFRVSAGPLSEIDDDTRTARTLGMEVAVLPLDGTRGPETLAKARELAVASSAVILTPFAVGKGNLTSLTLARDLPPPIPLYLVLGGEFARRDYTGGEAMRLYEGLRDRATARPRSASEVLALLLARFPPD